LSSLDYVIILDALLVHDRTLVAHVELHERSYVAVGLLVTKSTPAIACLGNTRACTLACIPGTASLLTLRVMFTGFGDEFKLAPDLALAISTLGEIGGERGTSSPGSLAILADEAAPGLALGS
jgi:hypothetical protein